jgi:tRNA threonylcarbamoyladenosine biosynthesis protein TsaB
VLILSIDSSQPVGSVTLERAKADKFEIIETAESRSGKFSAQLIPTVKRLLEMHALKKSDIDVIAAASGPGTFTGLRVGLAAVKALAEMLGKPIVTVSVLEALAAQKRAIAVTDAGKGFWYLGDYRNGAHEQHCSTEQLAQKLSGATNIVTTATLPDSIRAERVTTPISELVARVAAGKAARRGFADIDMLDANYVRPDEGLYKTS